VLTLHDPVFFHQLGGFGALAVDTGASTAAGEDAGYLLGVVSADRLGVIQAVAVHPSRRGQGLAGRLVERFTALAGDLGARAVQAVAVPGSAATAALAARLGAHAAPSPDHAGPGADRVLFTWGVPAP
jgi:GNAT superfamily N-acetyltransferase